MKFLEKVAAFLLGAIRLGITLLAPLLLPKIWVVIHISVDIIYTTPPPGLLG